MGVELDGGVFATGTLPPSGRVEWFQPRTNAVSLRFFQALPIGGNYLPRDQSVQITRVFYAQLGTKHLRRAGEYQVHVVVRNLDPVNECAYGIQYAVTRDVVEGH
jgi:hypothetical protein